MKKIVVAVLLMCPIFVFAQSRGDRIVIRDAWLTTLTPSQKKVVKRTKNKKSNKSINIYQALENAIKRAVIKRDIEVRRRQAIIKAIKDNEKLPGETEEQYRARKKEENK